MLMKNECLLFTCWTQQLSYMINGCWIHVAQITFTKKECVMLSVQQPWTLWESMTIAIAECDLAGWCFRMIPVQVAQKRSAVSTLWTVFIEHSSIFTWSTVIRFVLLGKGVRAMMLLIEQPWTAVGNRWSTVIGFTSLHMFIIGFISSEHMFIQTTWIVALLSLYSRARQCYQGLPAMRLIVLNSLYTIHTCSHHVLLTGTI